MLLKNIPANLFLCNFQTLKACQAIKILNKPLRAKEATLILKEGNIGFIQTPRFRLL